MYGMKLELYLKKQIFIIMFIGIGTFIVGYNGGWTAPVIPKLKDPEQTPLPEVIGDKESSWIGSVIYLGIIIGSFVSGYLSSLKGRRPCLCLGSIITIVSYSILSIPQNIAMIYCARFFCGIGSGMIMVTNIVYIGEVASSNIRGALLSCMAFNTNLGTLLIFSIGPYISYSTTGYVAIILTIIYASGVYWFVPESPMFLVLQGRKIEAGDVLKYLGRSNEIDQMMSLNLDNINKPGCSEWRNIFIVKNNRRALFITLSITIFQQISGISAIILFSTTIFELVGYSIGPATSTIIIGATQTVTSSITPFLMERCGRRVLLLVSSLLSSFSLVALGVFFYLDEIHHPYVSQILWLPLASMVSFLICYNFGLSIVPDTLTGEMFHPNDRSTGSAITITIGLFFGFIVSTTFGYLLPALGGHMTFWMYAAACAAAFVFTAIFVPETKGKTLFEIQDMLSK